MKRALPISCFAITFMIAGLQPGFCRQRKAATDRILDRVIALRDSVSVDLPELTPVPSKRIAEDADERLVLVKKLKQRGFAVTDWGRGNWMDGPRIVVFTMQRDSCECTVSKRYYRQSGTGFPAVESITCRPAIKQENSDHQEPR